MRQLTPIPPVPPIRRDMDIMANRLPSSEALAGESLTLEYEDGVTMSLTIARQTLRWSIRTAAGEEETGESGYDAVEMRPDLYFIDFTTSDRLRAFSHVVDFRHGRGLTVWNAIVDPDGRQDLHEWLRPCKIAESDSNYQPITETRELLGKRLFCEYSHEAALEHIYVNSRTIVWQWLLSPAELEPLKYEVGIEAASTWKIQDNLYLLSTRGDDPIELTLLIDLDRKRNVGRLFGTGPAGPVDRRCGAKVTFLGEFNYPAGYEPG